MAKDDPGTVTPAAAVARHLEWLEFALEAARDEEIRRRGRLEKATDKNRSKRTVRLGEVGAEIRELTALVTGLKDLQARAASASAPAPAAAKAAPRRTSSRATTGSTRSRTSKAAGSPAAKTPAAKPARRTRKPGPPTPPPA